MLNNKKGFTIIELLIVIAIIGLLATISIVALNGARQKGRDVKRVADIKQIQRGLEFYFNDTNSYPTAPTSSPVVLGSANAKILCDAGFVASISSCPLNKIYMSSIPVNPIPGGSNYVYTSTPSGQYVINFSIEDATSGLISGAHTATEAGIQ